MRDDGIPISLRLHQVAYVGNAMAGNARKSPGSKPREAAGNEIVSPAEVRRLAIRQVGQSPNAGGSCSNPVMKVSWWPKTNAGKAAESERARTVLMKSSRTMGGNGSAAWYRAAFSIASRARSPGRWGRANHLRPNPAVAPGLSSRGKKKAPDRSGAFWKAKRYVRPSPIVTDRRPESGAQTQAASLTDVPVGDRHAPKLPSG